jgi:predicted protein tyrosine phosphatase
MTERGTPRIWVCGVQDMPEVVNRLRPVRVVSLLPETLQPVTPPAVAPSDHLRIVVDDIDEPAEGLVLPNETHVRQLVAFVRETPPETSIVIHCLAGVSRSTAAALVTLALDRPGRETEAASLLRAAAPFADPNRRLIEVADQVLARDGALVKALESMGESEWLKDVRAFELPRSL